MPLADYFKGRFQDPYVQAGIVSRPQNWQMRLGSLSAALGNMDRPGMLGQALAQAGTIYQDQRAGALEAAFTRAQDEAKRIREEELLQMKREEYEQAKEERRQKEITAKAAIEQEVVGREALRRRLSDLDLPMQYADNPTMANDAIQEAQMQRRPKAAPSPIQLGDGRILETDPVTGQRTMVDYGPGRSSATGAARVTPAYVDALVAKYPQHEAIIRANPESFATQAAQSVFEPPGKSADPRTEIERRMKEVREDSAFTAQWEQQWEAQNKIDPNSDATPPPPPDDVVYTEAMRRKKFLDDRLRPPGQYGFLPGTSGLESIRRSQLGAQATRERVQHLQGGAKDVRVRGGEQVAGTVLPSPKKSSPAIGQMGIVNATPKKTSQEAQGLARLEDSVAKGKLVLPAAQAAALESVIKQMTARGVDPEEIADWIEAQVRLVVGR